MSSTGLRMAILLSTSFRFSVANRLCTTFVLSKQSMQLVRRTPFWNWTILELGAAASEELGPAVVGLKK